MSALDAGAVVGGARLAGWAPRGRARRGRAWSSRPPPCTAAAGGQLILPRQAAPDGGLFGLRLGGLDLGYQRGQLALDLGEGLLAGRQACAAAARSSELRRGSRAAWLVGGVSCFDWRLGAEHAR